LPGRTFAALLRGEEVAWDGVAFYEFENTRAIRTGEWKYVNRFPSGPDELYDLRADPGERKNLVNQPDHAATQGQLARRLEEFFQRYADAKYDLRRGGTSKAPLLTPRPRD
jgi:arylsulfatase A-like enzyme